MNPVLAGPEGAIALDARVVLHDATTPENKLPRPSIRPYPADMLTSWELNDGTPVTIRPIRPEDEPAIAKFHETLSEESVRQRYFVDETQHARHRTSGCYASASRIMTAKWRLWPNTPTRPKARGTSSAWAV